MAISFVGSESAHGKKTGEEMLGRGRRTKQDQRREPTAKRAVGQFFDRGLNAHVIGVTHLLDCETKSAARAAHT